MESKFDLRKIIIYSIIATITVFALIVYMNLIVNPKVLKEQINNYFHQELIQYKSNYNVQDKNVSIKINGNIQYFLFPKTKLTIGDVELKNIYFNNVSANAKIKNVVLNIKIFPLFFRQIKVKNIEINGGAFALSFESLLGEYMKKTIETRRIKVDENEIEGVSSKIVKFLDIEDSKQIENGFKNVEVEIETLTQIDNTFLCNMSKNLVENFIKKSKGNYSQDLDITLSNHNISIFNQEKKSLKDILNINGKINIVKNKSLSNLNFVIDNELINLTTTLNIKNNVFVLKTNANSQNIKDFLLNYTGKIGKFLDLNTYEGKAEIDLLLNNISQFLKIITFNQNPLSSKIINNENITVNSEISFNNGTIETKNTKINSKNFSADIDFRQVGENVFYKFNLKNLNLDSFLNKSLIDKNDNITYDDVLIFKTKDLNYLTGLISKNNDFKKNINFEIDNENFQYNSKKYRNNKLYFNIEDSKIKINSLEINGENGVKLNISEVSNINNLYVHKLKMESNDFNHFFNEVIKDELLPNGKYQIDSNLIITNDKIFLVDSKAKNDKIDFSFNFEYSFDKDKYFKAVDLNIENYKFYNNVSIDNKKTDIKTKLLFLNELKNNLFLKLNLSNISYMNYQNIYLQATSKIDNGVLYIKDILLNTENIRNLSGKVNLNIIKISPHINLELNFDEFNKEVNLIPYILNINKYNNILNRGESVLNQEFFDKYWANLLFKIPSFNGVYGNVTLKGKSIIINNANIDNFVFDSEIKSGNFDVKKFNFKGLGGNADIIGNVNLGDIKGLNLKFTKNVYNLEELQKLFTGKADQIGGVVGLGGFLQADGKNADDLVSSTNAYFEFIGNNFYVKKLGLHDLQQKLSNIHVKKDLLNTINPENVLIRENNGTLFKKINGKFYVKLGVLKLNLDAENKGLSNKLILSINNNDNNTIIDLLNTSVFSVLVNKSSFPIYTFISFKEDLKNKALLDINIDQINEYLEQVRTKVRELENKKKIEAQKRNEKIKQETELIREISENIKDNNN